MAWNARARLKARLPRHDDDGWDYWLTHTGSDDGWILNSKRSNEAGWDAEPPPTHDRAEVIWHDLERELITREQAEQLIRALPRSGRRD